MTIKQENKMEACTLAIDLDGVLFKIYWGDETVCFDVNKFGEVIPGARESMKALKKAGFYLIVHTCRTNPELNRTEDCSVAELQKTVELKLKEEDIPFDEVFAGVGKPIAAVYIDDRALKFESWNDVLYKLGEKNG
jgi:histidinol phosphatase-like enzyme